MNRFRHLTPCLQAIESGHLTVVSTLNVLLTQLDGVENAESFEKFTRVPDRLSSTMKHTTIATKVSEFLIPSNRE